MLDFKSLIFTRNGPIVRSFKVEESKLLIALYKEIDCEAIEPLEIKLKGKRVVLIADAEAAFKAHNVLSEDAGKPVPLGWSIKDDHGVQQNMLGTIVFAGIGEDASFIDSPLSAEDIYITLMDKAIQAIALQPLCREQGVLF